MIGNSMADADMQRAGQSMDDIPYKYCSTMNIYCLKNVDTGIKLKCSLHSACNFKKRL